MLARARRVLPCALALLLAGCRGCPSSRPPIHVNPNMDTQPRVDPQSESAFFYDGASMRTPVEGTVPVGGLREDAPRWTGKGPGEAWVTAIPVHVDAKVLARGEQRYEVFCGPCHGPTGDGKGMLFQRAQVQSANLMEARFRAMPVGQLFDEVTHGFGLMPAYGPFVTVEDRWAILAYLRQLQAETPVPVAPAAATAEASAPAAAPAGDAAAPAPAAPATPAAPTGGGA